MKNLDLYLYDELQHLTTNNLKTGVEHMNPELLKSLVERIEKLNADAEAIAADIKEVYSEAKMQGYDPKMIKKCIALRKKDKDEIDEEDELLAMYRSALGL